MKTIVFYGLGLYGHFNPTINVARELARRGYRVIYYCTDEFKKTIEEAGIEYRSYDYIFDIDVTTTSRNVGLMSRKLIKATKGIVPILLQDIQKEQPDCIVHDALAMWGKIVAKKLHVPAVSVCATLAFNRALILAYPQLFIRLTRIAGRDGIISMFDYYKMILEYRIRQYAFDDIFINKEPLTIVFTSSHYHPKAKSFDKSFKFVGPSIYPREEKNNFMRKIPKKKKIIYISLGTVINDDIRFYKMCIAAFKDTPYQIVLSLGKRFSISDLGELPKNVIVERYINQLELLKHVDVFVTHSGMNGVNESMYYGVPMVLIPDTDEQTALAWRAEELGVGIYLNKRTITQAKLLDAVTTVLQNKQFSKQVQIMQKFLQKTKGYNEAVDEIEKYIESRLPASV